MGGVSPETRWASYKYEIKFWYTATSCWIFYVNYTMVHGSTNIKYESRFFVIRPTDHTWIAHFIAIKCDMHYCSSHYLQLKGDLVLTIILKYEGRGQLREENALTNGGSCCRTIIAESTFLKLNMWVSGNTHIHFYLLHSHIHFSPL